MDHDHDAEALLRSALIDADDSAAVSLRVAGLPVSESLTVVFHGRRDLGTIQTYVAPGSRGAGSAVGVDDLLRVPCDLDLAEAEDREDAARLYVEQARALRDALVGADTVLGIWREPLEDLVGAHVTVNRAVALGVRLPAPRLMPSALVAAECHVIVAPVCSARPLAAGRPPLGIACAQQDVVRIYPLSDDPERCLTDFLEYAAACAREAGERLDRQESSVLRFLELSGDE